MKNAKPDKLAILLTWAMDRLNALRLTSPSYRKRRISQINRSAGARNGWVKRRARKNLQD